MLILGYIVTTIGIVLLLGNVFHFMPTIPMAGAATIFVGSLIIKKGKSVG